MLCDLKVYVEFCGVFFLLLVVVVVVGWLGFFGKIQRSSRNRQCLSAQVGWKPSGGQVEVKNDMATKTAHTNAFRCGRT